MKVITLWQPWATWVVLGWKTIETRLHPRFGSVAGEVMGIHAGLRFEDLAMDLARQYLLEAQIVLANWIPPRGGALIGTVRVLEHRILTGEDSRSALIDCGNTTRYGLILADPKSIPGIPMKGKQGIWTYTYPHTRKDSS